MERKLIGTRRLRGGLVVAVSAGLLLSAPGLVDTAQAMQGARAPRVVVPEHSSNLGHGTTSFRSSHPENAERLSDRPFLGYRKEGESVPGGKIPHRLVGGKDVKDFFRGIGDSLKERTYFRFLARIFSLKQQFAAVKGLIASIATRSSFSTPFRDLLREKGYQALYRTDMPKYMDEGDRAKAYVVEAKRIVVYELHKEAQGEKAQVRARQIGIQTFNADANKPNFYSVTSDTPSDAPGVPDHRSPHLQETKDAKWENWLSVKASKFGMFKLDPVSEAHGDVKNMEEIPQFKQLADRLEERNIAVRNRGFLRWLLRPRSNDQEVADPAQEALNALEVLERNPEKRQEGTPPVDQKEYLETIRDGVAALSGDLLSTRGERDTAQRERDAAQHERDAAQRNVNLLRQRVNQLQTELARVAPNFDPARRRSIS